MAKGTLNCELENLKDSLREMGRRISAIMEDTITVVWKRDVELADKIVFGDAEIDKMERQIEQKCLDLITHQAPIAGDLRLITSALKILTDLERIGDQCADVCEIIATMTDMPDILALNMLPGMFEKAQTMYNNSLVCLLNKNTELAHEVIKADDEVDALFIECVDRMAKMVNASTGTAGHVINLMLIAKYIERIADHATNIAEWAIYLATGKHPSE